MCAHDILYDTELVLWSYNLIISGLSCPLKDEKLSAPVTLQIETKQMSRKGYWFYFRWSFTITILYIAMPSMTVQ